MCLLNVGVPVTVCSSVSDSEQEAATNERAATTANDLPPMCADSIAGDRHRDGSVRLSSCGHGEHPLQSGAVTPVETRSVLQLGADHRTYGEYASGRLSDRNAWAITVGKEKDSPSAWAKGDPEYSNEDGLLLAEQGELTLLAVADAHFGRLPSHELLAELREHIEPIPSTLDDLTALLHRMAQRDPVEGLKAGTSFLVAIYDRGRHSGFGASYWDSTLAVLGPDGHRAPATEREAGIVYLAEPSTLEPAGADLFTFQARPGDLLLAYTDGVDACHYNQPDTSVTPVEMERLFGEVGGDDAKRFLESLVELAMAGVNGNPGGQDNIAAIAVQA